MPPSIRRIAVCLACLCASAAMAQAVRVNLRVEAPSELRVGARLTVPILLAWTEQRPEQLIVTAHAEGRALDVVKARLLRADAVDPSANPLRFELPIVASSPGVAVLRISARTYHCAFRCSSELTEATQQVLVREP